MGNNPSSSSSPTAKKACKEIINQVKTCKSSLNLKPNECYNPNKYKGECDEFEYLQKKCISYYFCNKQAIILYDDNGGINKYSRNDKIVANKKLQICLSKYNEALSIMGCEN